MVDEGGSQVLGLRAGHGFEKADHGVRDPFRGLERLERICGQPELSRNGGIDECDDTLAVLHEGCNNGKVSMNRRWQFLQWTVSLETVLADIEGLVAVGRVRFRFCLAQWFEASLRERPFSHDHQGCIDICIEE